VIPLIITVLVVALVISLGCNIKQEYDLANMTAERDELLDALTALQQRTETRSTATHSVQFNDPPTGMRCV